MYLYHQGSIFTVILFSKLIDITTSKVSCASSFTDFLESRQEFEDMAVPGDDEWNIINSDKGRKMVHWLKTQEVWADIHLRNELTSLAKYLFCLSDLKGSDREGMKGGGGWPRDNLMTYIY